MSMLSSMSVSILLAVVLSIAMTVVATVIWFKHDSKHRDLDDWVQFGFSRDTLRHALLYYRFMGISMVVFYVLFNISLLMLEYEGYPLFVGATRQPLNGGPIANAFFSLDLVLRGGFFDFMQHFDLHVTHLYMNRKLYWFVWYAFVFRMFYALTLIRILFSFAWIWTRIRLARQQQREMGAGPRRDD